MNFKRIAVLTSQESWFVSFAQKLVEILKSKSYEAKLFFRHEGVGDDFPIVFILSYFGIIKKRFLQRHVHNLVVHESNLPKGRGWAPLFWQILEGKNKIPVVLFEATDRVDAGGVYIKDFIVLKGYELYDQIRERQAEKTIELCLRFLDGYEALKLKKQKGTPTFYRKRTPPDSELYLNKTLKKQFNLLRIVNNDKFPAFFHYKGHKYILKIYRERKND